MPEISAKAFQALQGLSRTPDPAVLPPAYVQQVLDRCRPGKPGEPVQLEGLTDRDAAEIEAALRSNPHVTK